MPNNRAFVQSGFNEVRSLGVARSAHGPHRNLQILFATDLSANADQAMRQAVALGQGLNADIHVVHVTEPLSSDAIVTLQMFMQDKSAREKAIKDRRNAIKDMLKANQQAFVASLSRDENDAYSRVVSVELVEGHPAEDILRLANELKCDLIVMGAHDHGTGHTFLGTVAKRVLRRTKIPTLIVPRE